MMSLGATLQRQLQLLMNQGLCEQPELSTSHAHCSCITPGWLGEPKIPNPCVSHCLLCSHSIAKQALTSLSASTPDLPPASGLAQAKLFGHHIPIQAGPLLPRRKPPSHAPQQQGRHAPALTDTAENHAGAEAQP